MNFLADESFDFRLVRSLRAAGHDVLAVFERSPRAEDSAVIKLAASETRILLTEDKDFGSLVYVSRMASRGVILIRCPEIERSAMHAKLIDLVAKHGAGLRGTFVVVTPKRARFSTLPLL